LLQDFWGLKYVKIIQKESSHISIQPPLQNGMTTRWFDIAAQNNEQKSGAEGLIRNNEHTMYK
jgi:hypothetical protein